MNKLKVVILPHVNKSQELWDFPSRSNEKFMYEKDWKKQQQMDIILEYFVS